jgi:valyl-tRNA synthetase
MYSQFRLSEALKTVYSLIWDDFCSWYLEWVKPGFEQPIAPAVYTKTVYFFEQLMQLLHPFMPFITEEIYHQLKEQGDDLCVKQFTQDGQPAADVLAQGDLLKKAVSAVRDARVKNSIKPKDPIKLHILSAENESYKKISTILSKQVNAESVAQVKDAVPGTIAVVIDKDKFFIETEKELDTAAQKEQLLKDLEYLKGFLASVEKKLSNERFVQNAKPEVVAVEQRKKADAEEKIKAIEESLASL